MILHRGAVSQYIVVSGQRGSIFDDDEVGIGIIEGAVRPDVYLFSDLYSTPVL
jgi:hypothetical protein